MFSSLELIGRSWVWPLGQPLSWRLRAASSAPNEERSAANEHLFFAHSRPDERTKRRLLLERTHKQTNGFYHECPSRIGSHTETERESHSAALECFTSGAWQTAIGSAAASGQISSFALPLFISQFALELVQGLSEHSQLASCEHGPILLISEENSRRFIGHHTDQLKFEIHLHVITINWTPI